MRQIESVVLFLVASASFSASDKDLLQYRAYINAELGYIPLDKHGCNLLFQVISRRYENSSTIITTNRPYSQWQEIFNNDTVVTSAVLDRLLHHSDTITIEGSSYRMKDVIQEN